MTMFQGYLRKDGRKGIRNIIVVIYLVECAHHVARTIVQKSGHADVHLIGFPGCYPSEYANRLMTNLATHPNVGGCLLVSLGCESFDRDTLQEAILASGRPCELLVIQNCGGTIGTVTAGIEAITRLREAAANPELVPLDYADLVIGTICGGSDGTSGITANPAVGHAFDYLVAQGASCIFEETGELIGCEDVMAKRTANPEVRAAVYDAVKKAEVYYRTLGYGSYAPGNADGGLTTIEEKSLGAYAKSGSSDIQAVLKLGERPAQGGLYLLDIVPDGQIPMGFPNINDTAEIVEMIASGCHMILFTTGRGSVVGSAISPVIKICANPDTYMRMAGDMDINAGQILLGQASIAQTGAEIISCIENTVKGVPTLSEAMGHQEFILTYKSL